MTLGVITDEMEQLWEESHRVFTPRYANEFSFQHENIAEEAWYTYTNLYDEQNMVLCPDCGEIMIPHWCVWYCCCPKAPYGWHCEPCGGEMYYHDDVIEDDE
jgi:hypothetical protein